LNLDEMSEGKTLTLTGDRPMEPFGGEQDVSQQQVIEEFVDEGVPQEEEPLPTCCIDSLAMGLKTCEICGRNLEGRHGAGEELEQQRREQLKEELLQGEVQVGFSEELIGDEKTAIPQTEDDFTDVERALDALADGTFEKTIRKKEARKAAAKKMRMIGAAIGLGIVLVAAVFWTLRPKPHEVLLSRYKELMSQQEVGPQEVVVLFLDAASEQAQEVFNRISVMQTMPNITGGDVESVGEEHDETSLGSPGKDIVQLNEDLENLKKEFEEKEKKWQEESELKNLSPKLIETQINNLITKLKALQAEFDEKEAGSAKKLVSLRQQRDTAEQELKENEKRARENIDRTDPLGKATYKASSRNVQSLTSQIGKLEAQINQENVAHRQRIQELEAEYAPRFSDLREKLQIQQALHEKAKILQDPEKSPLIMLDKELKEIKNTLKEKEISLEEKKEQLETAKAFFKRDDQKQRVEKDQNIAEFVHISRNIVTSAKFRGGSKQKVLLVLKRYRAIIADQTIQGDWVVETILR